jgi:hypothetical protein
MRLKEKVAIITGVSYAGQAGYALARASRPQSTDHTSSRDAQSTQHHAAALYGLASAKQCAYS